MGRLILITSAALALSPIGAFAVPVQPSDPLAVSIRTEDAERFAELFAETGGRPTAAQLQRRYLDPGSPGIKIFTPNRIQTAENLAKEIAANREEYRDAIDRCLPVVKAAKPEQRAIYLALRGLYPDRPLPPIYIVFGARNSGGTAGPGGQVLGLEVLCKISPTTTALRQTLRTFFAHETVHTWQPENTGREPNILLRAILMEGAADYIASLVQGAPPSVERDSWGSAREAELWKQLEADIETTRQIDGNGIEGSDAAKSAIKRWVSNYQAAPEGWPYEMGYWMGLRIWQRYVDGAPDRRRALEDVLDWSDPDAILKRGAFKGTTGRR